MESIKRGQASKIETKNIQTENENQGGQQDEVEFLNSQDLAEQVKIKSGDVDSQQAFTVKLQPGKE